MGFFFLPPIGLRGWDKRLIVSDRAHLGRYSISVYRLREMKMHALSLTARWWVASVGGSTEQMKPGLFLWKNKWKASSAIMWCLQVSKSVVFFPTDVLIHWFCPNQCTSRAAVLTVEIMSCFWFSGEPFWGGFINCNNWHLCHPPQCSISTRWSMVCRKPKDKLKKERRMSLSVVH